MWPLQTTRKHSDFGRELESLNLGRTGFLYPIENIPIQGQPTMSYQYCDFPTADGRNPDRVRGFDGE